MVRKSALRIYVEKNKVKLSVLLILFAILAFSLYYAYSYTQVSYEISDNNCGYTDVNKMYIYNDSIACKNVIFGCDDNRRIRFDDECGCGCEFKEWFKREDIDFS